MARVTHVVLVDGLPVRSWVEGDDHDRWDDRWDDPWVDRWPDDEPFPAPARYAGPPRPPEPPRPVDEAVAWDLLCLEVGGEEALLALTDEPLPDEDVDWERVPEVARWPVRQVLEQVGRALARWPDQELRTACRRLVVDAAERHDLAFGAYDVVRTAAAAFWAVGRAGFVIGPELRMTNAEVLAFYGLRSSPEPHARRLLGPVLSVGPHGCGRHTLPYGRSRPRNGQGFDVGDPRLIVSARRAVLVAERDRLAPLVAALRDTQSSAAPSVGRGGPDGEPEWERALRMLTDGSPSQDGRGER